MTGSESPGERAAVCKKRHARWQSSRRCAKNGKENGRSARRDSDSAMRQFREMNRFTFVIATVDEANVDVTWRYTSALSMSNGCTAPREKKGPLIWLEARVPRARYFALVSRVQGA